MKRSLFFLAALCLSAVVYAASGPLEAPAAQKPPGAIFIEVTPGNMVPLLATPAQEASSEPLASLRSVVGKNSLSGATSVVGVSEVCFKRVFVEKDSLKTKAPEMKTYADVLRVVRSIEDDEKKADRLREELF